MLPIGNSARLVVMILLGTAAHVATGRADTAAELAERSIDAANRGENAESIRLATEAIALDGKLASAYKNRGRELFRAGRMRESIADFDQFVALQPAVDPQQWERGIAYYYAGQFEKGAAQFERYQTYDGHDVENSVWRFLCMAPKVGVARAQAVMLPIENDRRIPMMKVYDMYRGKCQPADVLAAARSGQPDPVVLAGRLFYAHLYLGLWFDALGQKDDALHYTNLAAEDSLKSNPQINRYMWDVARIHRKRLRGELKDP